MACVSKVLTPPDWNDLFSKLDEEDPRRLVEVLTAGDPVDAKGRYLHWDEMRHRTPPDGFTLDEWWLGTAYSRSMLARPLPLTSVAGAHFRFSNIDLVQEKVHRIDRDASGQIQTDSETFGEGARNQYLVSSLMEEAIASSLLEGAATTRRVAKEMLRTDRPPESHGERMAFNNFAAMMAVEWLANEGDPLTPADVLELHRLVTHETLKDPSDAGRIQQPGEGRVFVTDGISKVLHRPPPAEELPERMEMLCAFANDGFSEGFLHPVVRAILIHFWVGHDHPFVDGNGRTARALFYWSLLRSGYWMAPYISISAILRKAQGQYVKSYLKAETDDNDATYFVIHQLEVIERAIESLKGYLNRKSDEIAETKMLLRNVSGLNHRQFAAINEALNDPYRSFTIQGQSKLHRVVYQSARTDLLGLEEMGLLSKKKVGNRFEFHPADDLQDRLHALAKSQA